MLVVSVVFITWWGILTAAQKPADRATTACEEKNCSASTLRLLVCPDLVDLPTTSSSESPKPDR